MVLQDKAFWQTPLRPGKYIPSLFSPNSFSIMPPPRLSPFLCPLLFYSRPLSVSYLTTRVERPDACHIICHRTVFVHIPRTVSLLSSSAGAIHIFGWLTLCFSISFLG